MDREEKVTGIMGTQHRLRGTQLWLCLWRGRRCPQEADVSETEPGSGHLCQMGSAASP